MNFYAASVALLWNTAMYAPRASRMPVHEDAPLPANRCNATPREPPGGQLWRRWGRVAP
jgi:hypothetical protein